MFTVHRAYICLFMYPCNMRTCYWLLRLMFHSFELTFVALPATFHHVYSPQGLHLSLHVSCNMRTCYWLLRLMFHSFELTFVALPATFHHVYSPQGLHLSLHVSCNMRTCYWLPRLMFHSFEFTFVFPGLMQHAHMLQIAQTHVSQSLGLNTHKQSFV